MAHLPHECGGWGALIAHIWRPDRTHRLLSQRMEQVHAGEGAGRGAQSPTGTVPAGPGGARGSRDPREQGRRPAGGQGRPPWLASEGRSSVLTSEGQRPTAPLAWQRGLCRWAACISTNPNWVAGLYLELPQDHSGLRSDLPNLPWDHLPLYLTFQQPISLVDGSGAECTLNGGGYVTCRSLTAGWHGGRGG